MGQAYIQLGGGDLHKDGHGGIDFRIQRQSKAYKKVDDPSKRVTPIPIIIIIYILAQAYDDTHQEDEVVIADMITFAFYFLLQPGECMGTTSDDTPFKLQDVALCIGGWRLDGAWMC
jgi:hypothetical protein